MKYKALFRVILKAIDVWTFASGMYSALPGLVSLIYALSQAYSTFGRNPTTSH